MTMIENDQADDEDVESVDNDENDDDSTTFSKPARIRRCLSIAMAIIVAGHGLGPACHVQVHSVVRCKYVPGAPFCCVTANARYAVVRYDTFYVSVLPRSLRRL